MILIDRAIKFTGRGASGYFSANAALNLTR